MQYGGGSGGVQYGVVMEVCSMVVVVEVCSMVVVVEV